jgi:hypothetical protein
MAEGEPKTVANAEIDAYRTDKENAQKQKLLEDIFDDSVVLKGEDAQKRVEEGTEYYNHLEKMANDPNLYQHDYDAELIESAHAEALEDNEAYDEAAREVIESDRRRLDAVDEILQRDPAARRLIVHANEVTRWRNRKVGVTDNEAALQARLADVEQKFQELFDQYEEAGGNHDVLEYILEKAFAPTLPESAPEAPVSEAAEASAEQSATEATAEAVAADAAAENNADNSIDGEEVVDAEIVDDEEVVDAEIIDEETPGTTIDKKRFRGGEEIFDAEIVNDEESGEMSKEELDALIADAMHGDGPAFQKFEALYNYTPTDEEKDVFERARKGGDDKASKAALRILFAYGEKKQGKSEPEEIVVEEAAAAEAEQIKPEVLAAAEKDERSWWKKNADKLKEKFGIAYWKVRWSLKDMGDRVMNYGINDEMSDQQKEERRKKTRRNLMIGAGVVAAIGVISAVAYGVNQSQGGGESIADGGNIFTGDQGDTATNIEAPVVAPEFIPDPNFNIPEGGGGYELLDKLNVPIDQWDAHKDELNALFGQNGSSSQELYEMADGKMGFADNGAMSQQFEEYINKLPRRS